MQMRKCMLITLHFHNYGNRNMISSRPHCPQIGNGVLFKRKFQTGIRSSQFHTSLSQLFQRLVSETTILEAMTRDSYVPLFCCLVSTFFRILWASSWVLSISIRHSTRSLMMETDLLFSLV